MNIQFGGRLGPALSESGVTPDLQVLHDTVDRRLGALIAPASASGRTANLLDDSLCYALLSPGKRLRPLLTICAAWEFGSRDAPRDLRALDAGCALEMVHAASLVLDDLPAMDNAMLRRGRPAVHVRFGEDVALLTVVALLARAYAVLGEAPGVPAPIRAELVSILSQAIGAEGLSCGQLLDLRGARLNGGASGGAHGAANGGAAHSSEVNHLKTGVLFVAAVEMAAAIMELRDARLTVLRRVALHLGQAFQLMDDLADEAEDRSPEDVAVPVTLPGTMPGTTPAIAPITPPITASGRRRERRVRLRRHLESALAEVDPNGRLADLVRRIFSGAPRSPQ